MDRRYNVIVIGGGPGGYSAALYCVRAGLSTLVLEKLSAGGQMATTTTVDNYPGFNEGVDGFELGERMQRGAERFGAVTEYAEVTALELGARPRRVITTSGVFESDAVIIATGAEPKELGLEGESSLRGRGVSYCATCDGMFFRGKTVAVAGGGNTAVADALTLSGFCSKVYLIHRRDELRASKVYMEPIAQAGNIELVLNTAIEGIVYDKSVTGLKLKNKNSGEQYQLPIDGVFVAIGRDPDTALVKGQLELDESGYIAAGEDCRTSVPGVFAVGDVRTKPLRQIVTAAADGANAAISAEEYIHTL